MPESSAPLHVSLDAYRLALDDLHHTRDFGQRIDSMYVTIITLLLTADAYEIATTRYDTWAAALATAGVAAIGYAITARWRKGSRTLFSTITARYAWLQRAEASEGIKSLGVNFVTDEYQNVYLRAPSENNASQTADGAGVAKARQRRVQQFYRRTQTLQSVCMLIFFSVPIVIAIFTFFNLNPSFLRVIQQAIP